MGTTVKNNLADVTGIDERAVTSAPQVRSVYVYEAPVRIWHWINASAILVLCITGYLIGSPLSSVSGEASDHFQMGYIRFAHFAAGYVFAVGLIGRVYWAFVGNHHAREMVTCRCCVWPTGAKSGPCSAGTCSCGPGPTSM